MPEFSRTSLSRLETCHPDLQRVFGVVVRHFDCTILEGHRNRARQNRLFETGKSKVQFPESRHNSDPSEAVDAAPCPIEWNDRERFHLFAGFVLGVALILGVNLRWGGDWDRDTEVKDNDFDDLVHFELAKRRGE